MHCRNANQKSPNSHGTLVYLFFKLQISCNTVVETDRNGEESEPTQWGRVRIKSIVVFLHLRDGVSQAGKTRIQHQRQQVTGLSKEGGGAANTDAKHDGACFSAPLVPTKYCTGKNVRGGEAVGHVPTRHIHK